jgi:DNA-binding MarR family transcriptional regulator
MGNYHWLWIIGIIILFGGLGGIVNYFFTYIPTNEEKSKWNSFEFSKSLIIGISASFLMPLFLNMISSDLIKESKNDPYRLFIFSGFCLIAAISSKAFIQSISQKILKEFNEVKEKVNNVEKEIRPVIEKETEDDLDAELEEVAGEEVRVLSDIELDDKDTNRIKILKALGMGKYVYRSLKGISNQVKLDTKEVNHTINDLIADNYVDQSIKEKAIYFFITKQGREHLNWYSKTSYAHLLEQNRESKGS